MGEMLGAIALSSFSIRFSGNAETAVKLLSDAVAEQGAFSLPLSTSFRQFNAILCYVLTCYINLIHVHIDIHTPKSLYTPLCIPLAVYPSLYTPLCIPLAVYTLLDELRQPENHPHLPNKNIHFDTML